MLEYLIDDEEALSAYQDYLKTNKPVAVYADKIEHDDCVFYVAEKYIQRTFDSLSSPNDKLIYGKNPLTHIVNMTVQEDTLHIFQEIRGQIIHTKLKHNYFCISPKYAAGCTRLIGENENKWEKLYDNAGAFFAVNKNFYKFGLFHIPHQTEAAMTREGYTYYKNMKIEEVSTLSMDIETAGLDPNAPNAKVFIITNTFRKMGKIVRKTFNLKKYKGDDQQMIADWCDWVREVDPSILLGHNIVMFDLPYLIIRSKTGLKLGRDGSLLVVEDRSRELRKDGSQSYSYNRKIIFGREVIDTFFLAIKYDIARKYESYGLKPLIKAEGKEKPNRAFIDASKFEEYYNDPDPTNWDTGVQYAEDDSDDALILFDLFGAVLFYLCQVVPKSYQVMTESAAGSQINAVMVRAYLQNGESIPNPTETVDLQGAISFAIPGIYSNCLKIDFSALYPSIMMQYEVYNPKKDPHKHFATIVKYFANNRQKYKKLYKETNNVYFDNQQSVAKTVANSCYGFLSASGLQFNGPSEAAFITAKARELLSFSIEWATAKNVDYWRQEFEQRT